MLEQDGRHAAGIPVAPALGVREASGHEKRDSRTSSPRKRFGTKRWRRAQRSIWRRTRNTDWSCSPAVDTSTTPMGSRPTHPTAGGAPTADPNARQGGNRQHASYVLSSPARSPPPKASAWSDRDERVFVNGFSENSAARDAGVSIADRVVKITDRSIDSMTSPRTSLWRGQPGDLVDLVVANDSERFSVRLSLRESARQRVSMFLNWR